MARVHSRPIPDRPRVGGDSRVAYALTAATPVPAAATQDIGGVGGGVGRVGNGWQADAWGFYDSVGELRYVCEWLAAALSRCTIKASDIDEVTGLPTGFTEDALAAETVRDIAGGPAGQARLFSRMATHFTVPGEMYLAIIVRRDTDDGVPREEWHILSTDEVTSAVGRREITLPDGTRHEINDEDDTIARVWRPHPRRAIAADSPVRACVPILREIVRLGQHIEATAKSRLSGNGLMVLPQELSMPVPKMVRGLDPDAPGLPMPTPPVPDVVADDVTGLEMRQVTAQDVMGALIEASQIAIQDPTSAAALLPVMLQGPGEYLDKIQHITLGSEFTKVVMELREAATRRLALSLDVPPEILLGTADSNHWSAWAIEESAIKLHIEPIMVLICDALTEHILRPMLRLEGHPDPEAVTVWYDTINLTNRPDRSEDAKTAFEAGMMSAQAYMRHLGFDDDEMIDFNDAEQRQRFLVAMVVKNPRLLGDPVFAASVGLDATVGIDPDTGHHVEEQAPAPDWGRGDQQNPLPDPVPPMPTNGARR